MGKKTFLVIIILVLLLYPLFSLFQLEQELVVDNRMELAEGELRDFQRSIWVTWLVLVSIAVYYKWTQKKNWIFYFTYAFLFVSSVIYGIYVQKIVNVFDAPSNFQDSYSLGVFSALQNIIISGTLTGFLQAAVWWFTRRWHRG